MAAVWWRLSYKASNLESGSFLRTCVMFKTYGRPVNSVAEEAAEDLLAELLPEGWQSSDQLLERVPVPEEINAIPTPQTNDPVPLERSRSRSPRIYHT